MRKFLMFLIALTVTAGAMDAFALTRSEYQALFVKQPLPPVAAFSLTAGGTASSGATTTTIDYGTITYGSGCTRVLAVNLYNSNGSLATTITGITIGGTAIAQVSGAAVNNGAASVGSDIWESSASLAGTSGDVQVTYNNAPNGFGATSWVALYCLVTATPAASAANHNVTSFGNPLSVTSFSVPVGGGGIAVTGHAGGSTFSSWTNAATDATVGSATFGHINTTGTPTITATFSGNDGLVLAVASWAP